jgi:NAD(P)-dependent dehydrogenase (short-subunit alcohol dehydrogenase family)
VNAIVCGTFHTASFDGGTPPEVQEQMATTIGLRRIASPDEIVGTALYLAGEASSYLSGELLVLDGG